MVTSCWVELSQRQAHTEPSRFYPLCVVERTVPQMNHDYPRALDD